MFRKLAVLAALVVCVNVSLAVEEANPQYKSWKAVPKGTTITLKSVSEVAGNKTESVIVYTLKEIDNNVAKVEMVNTIKAGGQEIKTPGVMIEHKKIILVQPSQEKYKESMAAPVEVKVKIGDKEYTTQKTVMKIKLENGAGETVVTSWMCDDVPGTIVKTESKTTGKFESTTIMEVIEIKKP